MATIIRPELSRSNRYWISKHRYYELKHFCLQYPIWKKQYEGIDGYGRGSSSEYGFGKTNIHSDPTSKSVEDRLLYFNRIKLIEQAALEADAELASYILKAVTEGLSYTNLKLKFNIPCGRDMYYDRYRKFFWLLSNARD